MILNEIFSDDTNELFSDVPIQHHKKLLDLYFAGFEICKNKPEFIKISFLELIHLKFLDNSIKYENLEEEIELFYSYYKEILIIRNCEKINFGFYEDIKEFIWEYLNKE